MDSMVRSALKSQYHAALATVRQAIERCPDELWVRQTALPTFWQIAYHTVFFSRFYLMQELDAFVPWEKHRKECLEIEQTPPADLVPPTQADLLEYCGHCDSLIDETVDRLDLTAQTSGFYWYKMPKLDHEILSIRHIEQHAGQLDALLRQEGLEALDWQS